jgi:hypothetical protein
MTEETARLTLAFVGEQEVHRNNARSLLEDFVAGWLKQHRRGEVKVILQEVVTDTHEDLVDWASTSGYELLTGYSSSGMMDLLLEESDARLILVGDPNDDDTVYAVAEEAAKYRVQTRSLINGLEKVVFDDDIDMDDDLAGEGFHEVDVETGAGWAEDDDLSDEEAEAFLKAVDAMPVPEGVPDEDAAPDLDMLAALADDGEVEAQEEIKDIAATLGIDASPFETWVDAVEAIRGKQDQSAAVEEFGQLHDQFAPGDVIMDDLSDTVIGVVASVDEEGGVVLSDPEDQIEDVGVGPLTPYTREELEAMTFDQVKGIALDHGIPPGRGMKHGVFVNKILLATGVETESVKRKRGKSKLEVVAQPEEVATITAIHEVVQGHSLKEIADSLRHYADVLDPPEV